MRLSATAAFCDAQRQVILVNRERWPISLLRAYWSDGRRALGVPLVGHPDANSRPACRRLQIGGRQEATRVDSRRIETTQTVGRLLMRLGLHTESNRLNGIAWAYGKPIVPGYPRFLACAMG